MGKKGLLFLLSLSFLLLVLPQPPIQGQSIITIEGTVKEHSTGSPLPHVKILVLRKYVRYSYKPFYYYEISWERTFLGETDSHGYINTRVSIFGDYFIYAYYNDSQTPGFDYVPAMKRIERANRDYNLTFELWDGASMFLEGEALFVETTETPQSTCSVQDPDGLGLQLGEYLFQYQEGSSQDPHYQIPGVSPKHIIVPADTPFVVKIDSKATVEGETITRSFFIDRPGHFVLGKGEAVRIDLAEYTLSPSLGVVKAEASEIESMLEENEGKGFYLAVERQRFAQIASAILEAESYLSQGAYEACFTKLRYAYTEISNLRSWLSSMHGEASISVFLLIAFLAFTAVTASHLLFEEKLHEIGESSAFYTFFLLALYVLYPGSRLVEASLFLGASLLSFVGFLAFTAMLPMILKGRGVRGQVSLRNMVIPVFSIAKRSLRRRRLRSVLTFLSVMILVSSFIALTSFATGFGLTFSKISSQPGSSTGILVKAPKPPATREEGTPSPFLVVIKEGELSFPPLNNFSIGWFEGRPEISAVAPKYENQPRYQYEEAYVPLEYVGRVPIFGIMGVVPSAEAKILPWNETIVEGRFLSNDDEDGVLISAKLKEKLNKEVGATLTFRNWNIRLKIVGVFDDEKVENLRDFDGHSLLPQKIILISRTILERVTVLHIGLASCSAEETLVVTWRTASKLESSGVYISRINVALEEGMYLKEYAKDTALNKGFRAWASTEDGIYLAELSAYFEGKGLPLAVPWGIVVLNVVVTMLNSLYERKREIHIYSSIGMSPSHIAGAFLAEAAMIGVIGGGAGYLLGLAWYKVMVFFTLALQVKQKVSAVWVLGAIAVAMTSVLVGGAAAVKGSTVITPSLKRKWSEGKKMSAEVEPLELTFPVTVMAEEVEGFVEHVLRKLRSLTNDVDYMTSSIKMSHEEKDGSSVRTIGFVYKPAASITTIHTTNRIVLTRETGAEAYTVKLWTLGKQKGVQRVANLLRQTIMEWSIERGKKGV